VLRFNVLNCANVASPGNIVFSAAKDSGPALTTAGVIISSIGAVR